MGGYLGVSVGIWDISWVVGVGVGEIGLWMGRLGYGLG